MKMKKLIVLAAFAALASPLWAATQTVTLLVPGMTCPVCPITVKKALNKVPGVEKIDVKLSKKEVNVTFDNAKTSVRAITLATKDAGYPSSVVRPNK